MPTRLRLAALAAPLALAITVLPTQANAQSLQVDFKNGVGAWSTVLDGVMGGLSTGQVSQPQAGILRWTGELSLENNGGFSQVRTAVAEGACEGAEGFVLVVKGDGRTYTFDVRASNVRMMAGAFQQKFETKDGEWLQVRLPLDGFRLFSFGREVRSAPALVAGKIESVGITLADKKAGAFALEMRSLATYGKDGGKAGVGAATATKAGQGRDLATVARAAGLTKLLACVGATGLELPTGPVTIFAPTDAAFDALPKGTVEKLLRPESKATLRTILLQHIVEGRLGSAEVLNQRGLATLAGQQLAVDFAAQTVGGAGFVATDVPFDGGVVHVVDRVLLPETRSIAAIAVANESLQTLVAATKAAGLAEQLGGDNGPWTVFAPVDSAFAKLPKAALQDLLQPENRDALVRILGLHVVPGRIAARELLQKQKLTTLMGAPIEARLVDGKLTVGGARLIATVVQAKNGVIHLIDTVITEPAGGGDAGSAGRESGPVAVASVDAAAELGSLYALAVERGTPLFNRGEVEACAAIYEVTMQGIVRFGRGRVPSAILAGLQDALENGAAIENPRSRAWAYRRALDEMARAAEQLAEGQGRRVGLEARR
ncbi:MAG: CIA30 family protein [Planctomycetota bacterium]